MSKETKLIHTKQYIYTKLKTLLSKSQCLNAAGHQLHKQEKHADEIQLSGIKELTQLTQCILKHISYRQDPVTPKSAMINELSTKSFGFLKFSKSETINSERFF